MYIRTKDGRIAEVKENMAIKRCSENVLRLVYKDNQSICVLNGNDDIVNQAETIEELCDEFVIARNGERPTILINYDNLSLLKARVVKDNQKVYGAIWTDKGLIYVAKMNDKGELELI